MTANDLVDRLSLRWTWLSRPGASGSAVRPPCRSGARPASAVSRKLPSAGPSGSTASVAPQIFQRGKQASNHIRGILHAVVVRDTGQQVPLLGRAEHENRPAQITAQPHQFTQVITGPDPHLRRRAT